MRLPKICVAVQAATPAEMISRAEAALKQSHFLEFRLDALSEPASGISELKKFLATHPNTVAIGTCRRRPGAGIFAGTLEEELSILLKAATGGCSLVDLEIESVEAASSDQFEKFSAAVRKAGAALLVSFHDFARTRGLKDAVDRIEAFEPDMVKVVSTAQTLTDNLAVLRLIEDRAQSTCMVGIAMGEEGIVSRVLGPGAGSAFTFASVEEGSETAPGQVSGATMRKLYRADKLNADTRVFGVAGNPIAHSLSPLMHNTAFRAAGINAVLLPLKVRALSDLLTLMTELPMSGCAVTMPLKQQVLPHLAHMDPLTERIGACNTLRVGGDLKLQGFNTDVAGIVVPLEQRMRLKGARIAVLGAGGAARAAVFGLVDKGAEVFVVNRTHENAVALAKDAKARALRHDQLAKTEFDVIINSTPCGMAGSQQPLPIAENELNASLVFDMVYNPLETPLIKLAKSRGIPVITGLEMFVQQGVRQFEIWTGKPAPVQEMTSVVRRTLASKSGAIAKQ